MAKPTAPVNAPVEGLISLGYDGPDYSQPTSPGGESKTHTVFPTLMVCGAPASELKQALDATNILDGEFAAIVVLKNSMVRVSDNDEDADPSGDVEMEFTVKAIMPHAPEQDGVDSIMADFDKLPAATVHDDPEAEAEEHDEGE